VARRHAALRESGNADLTRPRKRGRPLAVASTRSSSAVAFRNCRFGGPRRVRPSNGSTPGGRWPLVGRCQGGRSGRLVYIFGRGCGPRRADIGSGAKWRRRGCPGPAASPTPSSGELVYGPATIAEPTVSWVSRAACHSAPNMATASKRLAPRVRDRYGEPSSSRPLESPAARNVTLEVGGPETMSMDESSGPPCVCSADGARYCHTCRVDEVAPRTR